MRKVDFDYCASSFLSLRTIYKKKKFYSTDRVFKKHFSKWKRKGIYDSFQLEENLKKQVVRMCASYNCALCLSGGIDSAILAKFMPKGSVAYTFKCVVPGIEVTDETEQAAKYASECGLKQKVVEIYWDDYIKFAPILMKHKGAPIHSIEIQIYKAALIAREDGFNALIFGESADVNYGGLSGLLSRDWNLSEFIERYSFVNPDIVLQSPKFDKRPFERHVLNNGVVDVHNFVRDVFFQESMNSYANACATAKVRFLSPFGRTFMIPNLDLDRIRRGENKYLVREVFNRLYKNFEIPSKIPMPRPMNEWLQNYEGPDSYIFKNFDIKKFSGDQKWMIYCLDEFVKMHR